MDVNDVKKHAVAFANFHVNGGETQHGQHMGEMFDAYWAQQQLCLPQQLAGLATKVSDNKDAFLKAFSLSDKEDEVIGFYMASERCIVAFRVRAEPWDKYNESISTADFLAWAEGLTNDK